MVRTDGSVDLAPTIRTLVHAIDRQVPAPKVQSVEDFLSRSIARPRFTMVLLTVFTLLALMLAAVGLYGVMSYSVAQRTREIGIRIALGAQHADVVRLVAWRAGAATMAGVAIGLVLTAAATKGLQQFLYGIAPLDYAAFGGATLALCVAAAFAAWLPARRATKIDPMTTIRAE